MTYGYLRELHNGGETVEFDIRKRGQYITTCVVDVDLLLRGIRTFPCGNGDDVRLTDRQHANIIKLVQAERDKQRYCGLSTEALVLW